MAITSIEQVKQLGGLYGNTTKQLQARVIRHLKEWRPKEYQMLKENGILREEALKRAIQTEQGIDSLMKAGYQHHETEEVMLPRYVLVPPEQEVIDEMERE